MSAVEELLLVSRQREDNDASNEGRQIRHQHSSRVPKASRRLLVNLSIVAICLVSLFAGAWLSLAIFFKRRLSRASVSLENAFIHLDSDVSTSHRLQLTASLPQSALALPVASYTLRVMDVKVEIGFGTEDTATLGIITLPSDLQIVSWRDFDAHIDGKLDVVDDDRTASALRNFTHLTEIPMWSKITCRVQAHIWYWLSLEFPLSLTQQPASVVGLGLSHRQINFKRFSKVDGQPHSLGLACEASLFNPSKIHVVTNELLKMRVHYNSTDIGSLVLTGFRITPGQNLLNGNLTIHQTAANDDVISRLSESYVGSMHSHAQLSVELVGPLLSKSRLLRGLLDQLSIPVNFKPAPVRLLSKLTADIVVGGRITHWPPASYQAILHLHVCNPLPSHARVESIFLEAFNDSTPLFRFRHDLDANAHVIPALANASLRLPLTVNDVVAPGNLTELNRLAAAGTEQVQQLRINAKFLLIISPSHRQQVVFRQDAVPGMMCYHRREPEKNCGEMYSREVAGLV